MLVAVGIKIVLIVGWEAGMNFLSISLSRKQSVLSPNFNCFKFLQSMILTLSSHDIVKIRVPEYENAADIPTLTSPLARRTLTHTRMKQLKKAASRDWNDPPPPPGLSDCCGSSCVPCVKDLWKEELQAWKERWGKSAVQLGKDGKKMEQVKDVGAEDERGAESRKKGSQENVTDEKEGKELEGRMPGAFLDW